MYGYHIVSSQIIHIVLCLFLKKALIKYITAYTNLFMRFLKYKFHCNASDILENILKFLNVS